jgi:AcrR family transcriptional regulator
LNFPAVQRELFPTSPNKGEQARRKLLLAALKKIGEKGYENASVREIADEAGQNVAAIAYYFGNKEKLYAAVLEGIGAYLGSVFGTLATETRPARWTYSSGCSGRCSASNWKAAISTRSGW